METVAQAAIHIDSPSRMELTEEEREWAKQIKAAAAEIPELDPLTDFMYAHLAIVTLADPDEANLALVMDRIANYQNYLQEHSIQGTCQDASKALDRTVRQLIPGHYMSFNYYDTEGCYVMAVDMTKYDRTVVADCEKSNTHFKAAYYIFHAQQPDFASIRNGTIWLFECSGYDWRNEDMFHRQCWHRIAELVSVYPVITKSKFFNTGMFVNLAMSMAGRRMPKCNTENAEVGLKVPGGYDRLDQLLVVPTLEAANERMLTRIKECLNRRFQNEISFSLDS